MARSKRVKAILLLLIMIFMIIGCAKKEDEAFLEKVKGTGFAYSEYFKSVDELDKRKKVTYYIPLPIDELVSIAPNSIKNAVHPIDPRKLPFEVNEQTAYVVTSEDESGNTQNQVQLTYNHKDDYNQTEEFYIITVTELNENPLDKYDFSKQQTDTAGNELRKEILIDDIPIFHQVITTDSALAYRYYSYDEKQNQVSTVVTSANELYTYYKGHLYHVGYLTENKNSKEIQEEILQLTRDFILGI
ncbi:hypothetical protein OR571_05995 [Psychrobacillus sp. NEAU-3TGS]|uniref:hypothetical protein n=1 Tax=Psychrobacillus sp. NEAU-3TGS TaxID=2995412 RepID=UPI002497E313|nr:hypothetical protein [Psychrobacillus sp. NEAU-3TGS]MDI2586694.1 hypothetical protein [Psychrobacillus sp. NEAU-3TGS]